jgi:hypothetical protein
MEQRNTSTLFLTSVLYGGGWLRPRPGRFNLGKETRYPLHSRPGGPQVRSGEVRKISAHRDSILDRPARSKSLYWLSYLGIYRKQKHETIIKCEAEMTSHTQKVEREMKRLKESRETARLSKYKTQEVKGNKKKNNHGKMRSIATARGLRVGHYPFTTCFVNGPTPTPSPSFQLA